MSISFTLLSRTFCELASAFWQSVAGHPLKVSSSATGGENDPITTMEYSSSTDPTHSSCWMEQDGDTRFFFNFSEVHPCAGIDWYVLGVLCVIVHTISWLPRWLLYEPFFEFWQQDCTSTKATTTTTTTTTTATINTTITAATTTSISRKRQRFSQVVTAASFHILMAFFAFRVLSNKEWLWNVELWSQDTNYIHDPNKKKTIVLATIEPDFKFYYLLYAARYISDLISLFFEPTKSDTIAYGIHHIVTIGLVLLSANIGHTRIGGVIMYFFDWADPPMLLGKACLYLSLHPDDIYQQVADLFMVAFVAIFVLTRNILFSVIVYVCIRDFPPRGATILSLKALLIVLVGLMTFWFALIVQTIYHQYFQNRGHVDDLREKPTKNNGKAKTA